MRSYIFDFEQEIVVKLGLNVDELLILDYLVKFLQSGEQEIVNIKGKKYGWITYDKLISDLPILRIGERQLRKMFIQLEKNKIIERVVISKKLYIYINQYVLYYNEKKLGVDYLTNEDIEQLKTNRGTKMYENDQNGENCGTNVISDSGTKVPPIVNYYKNRIKILINSKKVASLDSIKFLSTLKEKLKNRISALAYDICIKDMAVGVVSENLIILNTQTTDILKLNTNGEFYNCVCECLYENC